MATLDWAVKRDIDRLERTQALAKAHADSELIRRDLSKHFGADSSVMAAIEQLQDRLRYEANPDRPA